MTETYPWEDPEVLTARESLSVLVEFDRTEVSFTDVFTTACLLASRTIRDSNANAVLMAATLHKNPEIVATAQRHLSRLYVSSTSPYQDPEFAILDM